ncbi:unnamed protein product, partial [Rotaria magnacalcarata]
MTIHLIETVPEQCQSPSDQLCKTDVWLLHIDCSLINPSHIGSTSWLTLLLTGLLRG